MQIAVILIVIALKITILSVVILVVSILRVVAPFNVSLLRHFNLDFSKSRSIARLTKHLIS